MGPIEQPFDDLVEVIEDDVTAEITQFQEPWHILVVDDDEEVHEATNYALNSVRLLERPLYITHAYSAYEAEAILIREKQIAVILLDIVMESNDAGLRLVQTIREKLGLDDLRIILRTGQPGYAPELEVVTQYDVNDYRSKNELTQTRLITSITSALRSFEQIQTVKKSRQGLNEIINATSDLITRGNLYQFGEGIVKHLQNLFSVPVDIVVAVSRGKKNDREDDLVIGAGEKYKKWINHSLVSQDKKSFSKVLRSGLLNKKSYMNEHEGLLFIDGQHYPMAAYISSHRVIPNVEQNLIPLFCRNIALCSDNLAMIDQLNSQAFIDPLSGLFNRTHFMNELEGFFSQPHAGWSLSILDIDFFNSLVETIGAISSNDLLKLFADRLRDGYQGSQVYIARIAGDAFALIGPDEDLFPQTQLALLKEPFKINGLNIPLSVTVGLASLSEQNDHVTAVSAAYAALKHAKERIRGGYHVYNQDMSQNFAKKAAILSNLQEAMDKDQFYLVFQPQVDLSTRHIVGFETLLRWRRPDGEHISPAVFIPIAENSGMMIEIGRWVFDNSCRLLRKLCDAVGDNVVFSINVSAAQLKDAEFLGFVKKTLETYSLPPSAIDVELTETLAMEETEFTMSIIERMKKIGLGVSLDDFGTGFSSLAYLQRLQIDRLKIDQSFVFEIGKSTASEKITNLVIQLGRQLEMEVLAEGIETEQQAEYLLAHGCHTAQGYYFSRPMEFDKLVDWVEQQKPPV